VKANEERLDGLHLFSNGCVLRRDVLLELGNSVLTLMDGPDLWLAGPRDPLGSRGRILSLAQADRRRPWPGLVNGMEFCRPTGIDMGVD